MQNGHCNDTSDSILKILDFKNSLLAGNHKRNENGSNRLEWRACAYDFHSSIQKRRL